MSPWISWLQIAWHQLVTDVVVLCHGYADCGLSWYYAMGGLTNNYELILLDARGHGLSDPPSAETPEDINSAQSLSQEATAINQSFSQQIMVVRGGRKRRSGELSQAATNLMRALRPPAPPPNYGDVRIR